MWSAIWSGIKSLFIKEAEKVAGAVIASAAEELAERLQGLAHESRRGGDLPGTIKKQLDDLAKRTAKVVKTIEGAK